MNPISSHLFCNCCAPCQTLVSPNLGVERGACGEHDAKGWQGKSPGDLSFISSDCQVFKKLTHLIYQAKTLCNERSSRSHSVFILKIEGHNTSTLETCCGVLNLVRVCSDLFLIKKFCTNLQGVTPSSSTPASSKTSFTSSLTLIYF